jgi:hypothetical protein
MVFIADDLILAVDPDFLAKDADSARTLENSLVVGILAKPTKLAHVEILSQMMRVSQHLA